MHACMHEPIAHSPTCPAWLADWLSGVVAEAQRLIFCSRELLDEQPLSHYNIGRDNTLHLVVRLHGGGTGPAGGLVKAR